MPATTMPELALELEKQYWDAMKAADWDAVERLTADPCVVVGATGIAEVTRQQLRDMLSNQDYQVKSYRINASSVRVQEAGSDVAFVAYGIHEESERDGKPLKLDAFNSSVWVRRGGDWQCALHTESAAPGESR
ncbi:MAG: nuclear transport factor 2 family protein [Tepidiformaceae bacterium]